MRRFALSIAWFVGSLAWLASDHLVRDGDEEGHVGAAELFRVQLAGGDVLGFLRDALVGDLGEYPPLFPALVGLWWQLSGVGQPGHVAVRAVGLLGLLAAALATSALARDLHGARHWRAGDPPQPAEAAASLAFGLVLCLPLANGLARHFMPEGLLVGAVAVAVWAARRAGTRPGAGTAVVLGVALGLGLLVKQTFVLVAIVPVAVAAWRAGPWLGLSALTASAIAGPWYARHLGEQLAYGQQSVQGGSAGVLAHALYYPATAAWLGLGPAVGLLVVGAVGLLLLKARDDARPVLAVALAWGLGGLVLLTVVPKKYPRLLAPLTPAAALLVGAAAAHVPRRRLAVAAALAPAATWLVTASLVDVEEPGFVPEVDPRCLQRWLRSPGPSDLGLAAVAAAAAAAPDGPIVVRGGPEIPCAVQTTHAWASHLAPYLRRAGMEREVVEEGRGAVLVDWTADGPGRTGAWVGVPELGGGFRVTVQGRR